MQTSRFVAVLLLTCMIHICAETNVGTLEGTLGWGETSRIQKIANLGEGRYTTGGIDVTQKHLSIHGSKYTEIELDGTANQEAMFVGEEAHISLQSLRFKSAGSVVAIVEMQSKILFEDNTLIGTTIKNSFEVDGGELVLSNLKLEFENNNERRVSNLVNFGELGGKLLVLKTSIEQVITDGDRPLFGDGLASEISLTNCKFNQVRIDHNGTSNIADNIIGSGNVYIQDCSFVEVENALMGGVVNGLNSNRNLSVVGSLFKSCHNTKHITERVPNKKYHTDILSGDAKFTDDTFEDCSSQDFGGSISFKSDGNLKLGDVRIRRSTSYGGKGGAIYFQGNGQLTIGDTTLKECKSLGSQVGQGGVIYIEGSGIHKFGDVRFSDGSALGQEISEGGSIYAKGGQNKFSDVSFSKSSAIVTSSTQSNTETDQSSSLGGALMAIDWLSESSFSDVSFTSCVAGSGAGIYIVSVYDRIKFSDVRFKENIASVAGGGGIFAQDTNMIYLKYCKFTRNQAYGSKYGNDLHFSELGVETEQPDMLQIKNDMIYRSKSSSLESRVYIVGLGSQVDWLPDRYEGEFPFWARILLNVVEGIVLIVIIVICICCCYKCCGNCCGSCCSKCCGGCCCKGCSYCCMNCCLWCCCCQCSKNGGNDNDRTVVSTEDKDKCCKQCCQDCCEQCYNKCCQKNRTVDSSNSNYQQQHAAEEGQYYDKNNQEMQQRNGNGIVVVVADNAYIPQYGVQQQPYAAYQNPAYQYPQQNRPPLPPPLQNQSNNNTQVQYSPFSPQQQINPMYQQPPPQNTQMSIGKEDFLQ